MSFYSSNGCWTEHYHYEEIANLTNVQMGDYGEISKEVSDKIQKKIDDFCLLYTSPSPRDVEESRMPSSA